VALRKGDVVPVTFDQQLSLSSNREGDRFSTTVQDASYLPLGTHIDGYIKRLVPKQDDTPASMELAFDQIVLPDGTRIRVSAVPMPLDGKYVQRNPDGRYVAKQTMTRGSTVGVGALGGLVLGALIKRPFEGAFLGTLAGIVVAESSKEGQNLTIKKGATAGAAIQQPISFEVAVSANATLGTLPLSAFDIVVGRRTLVFDQDQPPYNDSGVTMIPLRSAVTQLGCTIDLIPNAIFIENNDHSLRLSVDSADYRFDGRRGSLSRAIVKHNGTFYGPVDVLLQITNDDVKVNGTKLAKPA
jgi:hypothetical protein